MTTQRLVECYKGTPITQLDWWGLIQYNRALSSLGNLSGSIDCGRAAELGITWEYRQVSNGK